MKIIRDTTGREWTIEINFSAIRRVKAATGVDLTKLVEPKDTTFKELTSDLFRLFDVVCAVLQPQFDDRNMTADQFGESLDEATAEQAAMAVLEGTIDFFREEKRTLLKRAYSKVTKAADRLRETGFDHAMKAVETDEFDQVIEAAMKDALDENESTSGNSSTPSPELSESTPVPSLSAS